MLNVQKCFKNKDNLDFILIEKNTTIEEIDSWCRQINPMVVYTECSISPKEYINISVGIYIVKIAENKLQSFTKEEFEEVFSTKINIKEPMYNYYIQAMNSSETFTNKVIPKYTIYQNKHTKKLVTAIQITTENLELLALQYGRLSVDNQYLIMTIMDGRWSAFVGDWIIQHDDYIDSIDDTHFHLYYEKPRKKSKQFMSKVLYNHLTNRIEYCDENGKMIPVPINNCPIEKESASCEFDTLDFKLIKPRFRTHNEKGCFACKITKTNSKILADYCKSLDINTIHVDKVGAISVAKAYINWYAWLVFYVDPNNLKTAMNIKGYNADDFKKNYKLTK